MFGRERTNQRGNWKSTAPSRPAASSGRSAETNMSSTSSSASGGKSLRYRRFLLVPRAPPSFSRSARGAAGWWVGRAEGLLVEKEGGGGGPAPKGGVCSA